MNRRGFLGLLGALGAGAVLDPERLLWVPGAKLISVPKPMRLMDVESDLYTSMLNEITRIIMYGYSVGDPSRRGIFPKPPLSATEMQLRSEQAYERAASDLMRFLNREMVELA